MLFGDRGNGDVGCGMGHAAGVLIRAEYDNFLVARQAEAFYAFVGLLAVIEGGGHAVDSKEGIGVEDGGAPLFGFEGVVRFDMTSNYLGVRKGAWEEEELQGNV